jgi:molecular chaperone DnaK (HSP70)
MNTDQSFTLDGVTFPAEDVIGHIIQSVVEQGKRIAEQKNMDTDIQRIVLTVPARFGLQAKETIRQAAEDSRYAGVKVEAMVAEPVAAALAYFQDTLADKTTVMVYDLGGGTCDIAIVRANSRLRERFEVVDTDMLACGGRDWDSALGNYILGELIEQSGCADIAKDAGYLEDIRRAAKKAKERLSEPNMNKYTADIRIGSELYSVPITQGNFESTTNSLLMMTLDRMQELYEKNRSCAVEKIICVGGSSNMPQVKREITKRFPSCEVQLWEPSAAIAYGAAVYTTLEEPPLTKATFSYGIRCYEDHAQDPNKRIVVNLIHKGQTLPAEGSRGFQTVIDDAESVRFPVYESDIASDKYDPAQGKEIGMLSLKFRSRVPKGYENNATMSLTKHGLLEVKAFDQKGNRVEATFDVKK